MLKLSLCGISMTISALSFVYAYLQDGAADALKTEGIYLVDPKTKQKKILFQTRTS